MRTALMELLARIPEDVEWCMVIIPEGVSDTRLLHLRMPSFEFMAEKLYNNADRVVDQKCKPRQLPKP